VGRTLLDRVQALIERTYALETGLSTAAPFVIGDRGLLELYAGKEAEGRDLRRPGEAMILVSGQARRPRVRLYYPDRLVMNLEAHPPEGQLHELNLRDAAAFVEELDHLLVLAAAARAGRVVRAVELELHANVTKTLVLSLWLARSLGLRRLEPEHHAALRHELLERGDYENEEPEQRQRYRDARRHAIRFLSRLRRAPRAERPGLLRRFSSSPLPQKLRLCA
jgi:hypothetical protein